MSKIFEKTVLPNGLRVLTAPMPQAKSVACFVMLAAGSRYETKDTNGIAHFAEHMFFKGTERRPSAREIAGEIDTIGGEFNAFTGKEYTGYYVKCAAEHRDTALDVLVDMLRHSKFDPEEIDREKGVIVEEMNMYYDTPRDYLEGVYDELLYGDQPLGWDIIGTKETVRAAKRDTFTGYLDHWYRAHRMVAGIAGDVGDDVVQRLEELLGDVADGASDEPIPVEWAQQKPSVKIHTKQSDQAHIRLGVHSYPIDHPDRYSLSVLATILGGGMSSRLFSEVRERRGLAYYIYGYNQGYTDAGNAVRAGRRRHRAHRRGRPDRRERVHADRQRAGVRGRAGQGEELLARPAGALPGGSARDDHVRPAQRSPRGHGARARRRAGRDRRGHGRGRPSRGGRHHPRRPPESGRDRPVRRRRALREGAFALVKHFPGGRQTA